MKRYEISCEISGPTAMWTRPDTGDVPVSYLAPTYSAVNGICESIVWLKSAEVFPTKPDPNAAYWDVAGEKCAA